MKAICIKNTQKIYSATSFKGEKKIRKHDLTIGKVYEIYELYEIAPKILPKKCRLIDDRGKNIHIHFDFFKQIEEFRDEQIQEILK